MTRNLVTNPPYRGLPPFSDDDTSREAALRIAPAVTNLRDQVMAFIERCGFDGATDEEISDATGMFLYTAAPRRNELVQMGRVVKSGRTRVTSRGGRAKVWISRTVADKLIT